MEEARGCEIVLYRKLEPLIPLALRILVEGVVRTPRRQTEALDVHLSRVDRSHHYGRSVARSWDVPTDNIVPLCSPQCTARMIHLQAACSHRAARPPHQSWPTDAFKVYNDGANNSLQPLGARNLPAAKALEMLDLDLDGEVDI